MNRMTQGRVMQDGQGYRMAPLSEYSVTLTLPLTEHAKRLQDDVEVLDRAFEEVVNEHYYAR